MRGARAARCGGSASMRYETRPRLTALVGFFAPPHGVITKMRILPLEEAVGFVRFGFTILVDPADERDLATWEREQRLLRMQENQER
jgi:hypothetical protein